MSTVNVTIGSTSGGGDKPPNDDDTTSEYEYDELAPIEDEQDSDEQEATNKNENIHKATKQSLQDAVDAAVKDCSKLKAELAKTEMDAKLLRPRINNKITATNKLIAKRTEANNEENARQEAALSDINVKWQKKRMLGITSADSPMQNRRLYDQAVGENTLRAEIARVLTTQYATEIASLITEREDLQASLTMAEMRITSLTRQLAEAETVRREQREALADFIAVELVERQQQQEALAASQQQHQLTHQSDSSQCQQSSSRDDLTSTIQQLPSLQHQPPPQQLSDVQQQQQTPTPQSQQTDVPSTEDATSAQAETSQSVALTKASLRRAKTFPG